jgi:hypothetical protein
MTVGAGADVLDYTGLPFGNDTVTDFDIAEDRIDLRGTGLDFVDLTLLTFGPGGSGFA